MNRIIWTVKTDSETSINSLNGVPTSKQEQKWWKSKHIKRTNSITKTKFSAHMRCGWYDVCKNTKRNTIWQSYPILQMNICVSTSIEMIQTNTSVYKSISIKNEHKYPNHKTQESQTLFTNHFTQNQTKTVSENPLLQ